MIKILLCDDDKCFLHDFLSHIDQFLIANNILAEKQTCVESSKLVSMLVAFKPDILFLDIDMPHHSGFDIARLIGEMEAETKPYLVFVSSYDYLVFESFSYQPFWFLRKTNLQSLNTVLNKLVLSIQEDRQDYVCELNGRIIVLMLKDILYFESDGHYINIHTTKQVFRQKQKIGAIEQSLGPHRFLRIHVGYLVNIVHITKFDLDTVAISDGTQLPLSRNRKKICQSNYLVYMRGVGI